MYLIYPVEMMILHSHICLPEGNLSQSSMKARKTSGIREKGTPGGQNPNYPLGIKRGQLRNPLVSWEFH